MIDSHCHLDHEPLFENLTDIINRSKETGVTKLLTICTTHKSFEKIIKIINKDVMIYGTFGIHPHETKNNKIDKQTIIKKVEDHNKIIGIGETGLDFFYNHSDKDMQIKSFKEHIEASIENKIPLIIHQRESEKEIIDVLKSYQNNDVLSLVFHCFTGSKELRNFCLDNNYYISISGIITFKNADELRNTLKDVPLSSILIETDSPFLSPVPFRGKSNEPSNVKYIAEYLSTFLKVSLSDIINSTDNNFYKLFSKAIRYNEISQ